MEDLTSHIPSLSLFLKIVFIAFTSFEILLPRFRNIELKTEWSSTFQWEIRIWMAEGGAFIFSLGFLMVIDIWASSHSWIPLFISLLLDLLLLVLILIYLFSPKDYGVAGSGIYVNGWILQWKGITGVERRGRAVHVSTKGHLHETKKIPLPEGPEERVAVMELMESAWKTEGAGPESEE